MRAASYRELAAPLAYEPLPREPQYRPRTSATRTASRLAHPQWLLGTLVCVLALVIATPVWAAGRAGASHFPARLKVDR